MSDMHTSAPAEPDMFAGAEAQPVHDEHLVLEIAGVLTHAAEVRIKLVGQDKHPVPVLCLDLKPLTGIRRSIHIEQIYTEATRKVAEEKAATLKRGSRVTFRTHVTDMRTVFPHVQSVSLNPQEH